MNASFLHFFKGVVTEFVILCNEGKRKEKWGQSGVAFKLLIYPSLRWSVTLTGSETRQ